MTKKKHYIHLYYGDGKGKTTAALGLALRAVGHGQKVVMLQWLKGRQDIGEVKAAKLLGKNFSIHQFGPNYFTWEHPPAGGPPEHKQLAIKGLEFLEKTISKTKYDILILDELMDAVVMKFIPKAKTISLIKKAAQKGEVIITGHKPIPEFVKLADLATEMKKIKHYFDKGVTARSGIEY
ncbi:cob(I)yrinic acid a,c-diamide adenosyltransferase [Patescibacteria group bacterium]|nr:cob(I)yrinic acid a,c-diamide adenosyltransferase [Patescibacteria group bacterium]